MLSKKIIFLTGATGTMGEEGLKQILSRSDRFNLRVLVRPSAKNKAFMSRYEHDAALEIVWGDLCCYDDILRCVTGADYVLLVGAFVSPEADKLPQRSLEVNLGSTMNIIRAIKAQPDPGCDQTGLYRNSGRDRLPSAPYPLGALRRSHQGICI